MLYANFDKKIRFSFFLPYGFIGQKALSLSINRPGDAYTLIDPIRPMEAREQECLIADKRRSMMLQYMDKYGYSITAQKRYRNTGQRDIRLTRLTSSGLYLLTNTDDPLTETKRLESVRIKNDKAANTTSTYLDCTPDAAKSRQVLNALATTKDINKDDAADFQNLFDTEYAALHVTPLATEPLLAKSIQLTSLLYSNQIYHAMKQTNIETLFRVNGYLTSIDRPHIETKQNIKPIQEMVAAGRNVDVLDFTTAVLKRWYDEHPQSFSFLHGSPDDPQYLSHKEWAATPIYYKLSQLRGFYSVYEQRFDLQDGSNKILNHSSIGLAVGRKTNYLVYHTSHNGNKWQINTESYAAFAAQKALDNECKTAPVLGANRSIENAIFVTPSVHQFAALFKFSDEINLSKYYRFHGAERRVDLPFRSVHIVPLNHSGVMELRYLMTLNPISAQLNICYNLRMALPELRERPKGGNNEIENIFDLTFRNTPVFVGHLMNYQNIYWAKKLYEEGREFYISCFPEQAKFYRKIMPDVHFL